MDVSSNPMPMSSKKCVMHGHLDYEKMDFFGFDTTYITMNNFWFLMEYPFKLIFSMMDVYSDPMPMSIKKRVMHSYLDTE